MSAPPSVAACGDRERTMEDTVARGHRRLVLVLAAAVIALRARPPATSTGANRRQRTSVDARPADSSARRARPPPPPLPPATAVPIPTLGVTIPRRADPELRGRVAERPPALRRQPERRRHLRRRHGRQQGDGDHQPQGPPQFIAFSRDGRRAYVSVWDKKEGPSTPSACWTRRAKVIATIQVKTRPFLAAVSPDGKLLFVPNHDTDTVSVIDTSTDKLVTNIQVAPNPHWVAFTPRREEDLHRQPRLQRRLGRRPRHEQGPPDDPTPASPHSIAVHPTRPLPSWPASPPTRRP